MAKTTREKIEDQIRLMDVIREKANINIVNCGYCGSVFLHERSPTETELECPYCPNAITDSDCPDFLYNGMQNNSEFEETTFKN